MLKPLVGVPPAGVPPAGVPPVVGFVTGFVTGVVPPVVGLVTGEEPPVVGFVPPVVDEPKILPANAPAPAPISVFATGLFSTLVRPLLLEPVVFVAVGVVVLLVIGLTAGFVVVLVIGLVAGVGVFVGVVAFVVVLVIGLVAVVVFVDTGVEPDDFTAGDAGRMVVAVFAATGALALLVIGATGLDVAPVDGPVVTLVMGATGRCAEPPEGARVEDTA